MRDGQPVRPRLVRHEGRRRLHDLRGRGARRPRGPARRRPDRRDEHGRGVVGRRRARPRPPRRRRPTPGIVTEPTGFDVWISCRGTSYAEVTVPGRPGPRRGLSSLTGATAARSTRSRRRRSSLDAIRGLREEWSKRSDLRHPRLSLPGHPADDDPRRASGPSRTPPSARSRSRCSAFPSRPTRTAGRSRVEREVDEWIATGGGRRPLAGRAPADGSSGGRTASCRSRSRRTSRSSRSMARGDRGRRQAEPALGARLLVRRRDLHPPRRHARDRVRPARLRPRRTQRRAHDRRARSGRGPRRLRARASPSRRCASAGVGGARDWSSPSSPPRSRELKARAARFVEEEVYPLEASIAERGSIDSRRSPSCARRRGRQASRS